MKNCLIFRQITKCPSQVSHTDQRETRKLCNVFTWSPSYIHLTFYWGINLSFFSAPQFWCKFNDLRIMTFSGETPRAGEGEQWILWVHEFAQTVQAVSPCFLVSMDRSLPGPQIDELQSPNWVSGAGAEMDYLAQSETSSHKKPTLRKIFYTSHLTYWDTRINWFLWLLRQTAFMMPSLSEEVRLKQGW